MTSSPSPARAIAVAAALAGILAAGPSPAETPPQDGAASLPLPRFVSLRAGEVNMRTGPGVQYPVEWIYQRQNLPVEIIAEHQAWRKIRDWQGAQGWVHQSMVGAKRTIIVVGEVRALRRKPEPTSPAAARAEVGVIGRLLACPDGLDWCRVEIGGHEGWLRREDFWGVQRGEVVE
jgi:SH3-like domain-containing protein